MRIINRREALLIDKKAFPLGDWCICWRDTSCVVQSPLDIYGFVSSRRLVDSISVDVLL